MTQAWAIKDKHRNIYLPSTRASREECLAGFPEWEAMEKDGYTCAPVTIVEGSAEPVAWIAKSGKLYWNGLAPAGVTYPNNWFPIDGLEQPPDVMISFYTAPPADEARRLLERAYTVMDELCTALDNAEADIGGSRPIKDIYADLGPITEEIEVHLARSET